MPRSRITDVLQSHLFWAFDATGYSDIPVFTPLFGFSSITSPEISVEAEQIPDGTSIFKRYVIKSASVPTITFSRAATLFDSDFYDWIMFAIYGQKVGSQFGSTVGNFLNQRAGDVRRNIVVIQYTSINNPVVAQALFFGLLGAAAGAGVGGILGAGVGATVGAGVGSATGLATEAAGGGIGPFAFASRIPARAWMLHNCLPVRYKAGGNFDADSPAVSVAELDVQPEYIEEYNLGVKP